MLENHFWLQIFLTSLTSFTICFLAIPSIIRVAEMKHLYDEPCERKNHKKNVPTLGGMGIFAGFIFSVTFWSNQKEIVELQYIISGLLILFFLGMKDDIIALVPIKKLFGQLVASVIIVFMADIRLTSLYGIFQIYNIPYFVSVAFSLLAILAITNSFNLIDGINTLAGSIGVFSAAVFGTWFALVGHTQYAIVSFALIGALLAFLYYNKTPAKVFMGDTGSLILGLTIAILTIKFIEFNKSFTGDKTFQLFSVPAIALSVLIIPMFDTLRVFTMRILQGRSPFLADRNHIHHILVDIGYSHIKATAILVAYTFFVSTFAFFAMKKISGELILFINLTVSIIMTFHATKRRRRKIKNRAIPLRPVPNRKPEAQNRENINH